MAKSFVLKALRIFGLEEILKISRTIQVKPVELKKAAGEELMAWNYGSDAVAHVEPNPEEKNVLPFNKKPYQPNDLDNSQERPAKKEVSTDDSSSILSSDFLLWHRELTRDVSVPLKKDAVKGYARSTQMYVVKKPSSEDAEKIRFASINGVLVDKKQA